MKVLVGKVKLVSLPILTIKGFDKYLNDNSGGEFFMGSVNLEGVRSSLPSLSTDRTSNEKISSSDRIGT
tara:strand:- start:1017 stop:1223 length:207 start_codon:yes stop_codon:yes gene_type:complete